mmetsp:Transcript_16622/g.31511  ORF Transcript_16622/g.31511 Transcript_16622/m.31511 type:complete len:210 (+) Transcript_16622:1051-1680(+)
MLMVTFLSGVSTNPMHMSMTNTGLLRIGPCMKEVALFVGPWTFSIRPCTTSFYFSMSHFHLRRGRSTLTQVWDIDIQRGELQLGDVGKINFPFLGFLQILTELHVTRSPASGGNVICERTWQMLIVAVNTERAFSFELPITQALFPRVRESVKEVAVIRSSNAYSSHPMPASPDLAPGRRRFLLRCICFECGSHRHLRLGYVHQDGGVA